MCGLCSRPWYVSEVVFVPDVDAVTVKHVLLSVLHVCMLRECEGNGNAGVVVLSVWMVHVVTHSCYIENVDGIQIRWVGLCWGVFNFKNSVNTRRLKNLRFSSLCEKLTNPRMRKQ